MGNNAQRSREFLVIGLGRFGSSLATTLHEAGHVVVAVDQDEKLVQHYASVLPHVIVMDATNREALEEIDVSHFDTAIVCIGSDLENNVLATVILRQLGVDRVIAKARTRTHQEILMKVGADEVVLPEYDAGVHLGQRLHSGQRVVDFMQIHTEASIVEVETPEYIVGKQLSGSDIRKKYGVTVIAIRRGDKVITIPQGDEQIEAGDILVVLGRPQDCDRFVLEA